MGFALRNECPLHFPTLYYFFFVLHNAFYSVIHLIYQSVSYATLTMHNFSCFFFFVVVVVLGKDFGCIFFCSSVVSLVFAIIFFRMVPKKHLVNPELWFFSYNRSISLLL